MTKEAQAAVRATHEMRDSFDVICKDADVYQGLGPAMAIFQTQEPVKWYVYVAFGMGGVKPIGHANETHPDIEMVLSRSIEVFRGWLQPNRTLVWRVRPEVDVLGGRWASYWRCVQLDDGARNIIIDWAL